MLMTQALMHMKQLWHYLCHKRREDVIVSMWSVINSEEYDSESLLYYMTHTEDINQSQIATVLQADYNAIIEFFDSLLVSDRSFGCFSIGYRFYYWKYYQNPTLQDEEYVHNKNHHSGYKPHELYVASKYPNIKDEVLNSKINSSLYVFTTVSFDKIVRKSQSIMLTKE
eukprot:808312_1